MEEDIIGLPKSAWVRALARRRRYSDLGSLVRGIIHNLNGSLQVMSMRIEILQRILERPGDQNEPGIHDKLDSCLNQVNEMKSLIDVLIQSAAHDESDATQSINLNDLLDECIALLHHNLAFKHSVKLIKAFSRPLPLLQGFYTDFHEGILNLIRNGLEAMEKTSTKELTLATAVLDQEVRVVIKDTGCGIGKDIGPFLFSPFFTTKGENHDGLGLVISKELLAAYGAKITYSSQGGDTAFSVAFPLHP